MYIEGRICNLPEGDFSLGIYSQSGFDPKINSNFYEICIGLLFFEIVFGKINK